MGFKGTQGAKKTCRERPNLHRSLLRPIVFWSEKKERVHTFKTSAEILRIDRRHTEDQGDSKQKRRRRKKRQLYPGNPVKHIAV
jgi:hypothetical protein